MNRSRESVVSDVVLYGSASPKADYAQLHPRNICDIYRIEFWVPEPFWNLIVKIKISIAYSRNQTPSIQSVDTAQDKETKEQRVNGLTHRICSVGVTAVSCTILTKHRVYLTFSYLQHCYLSSPNNSLFFLDLLR